MSTYGKYKRYISPVDMSRFVYKPSVIDYKKIVENDDVRKLQFTKFNNEVVPYTLLTTSLHHDNNLVTQPEFYRNQDNNLCIESVGSNINLFANDINKIHINGNVNFRNDTSFNSGVYCQSINSNNIYVRDSLIVVGNILTTNYNLNVLIERINAIEMSYNSVLTKIEEKIKYINRVNYVVSDFNFVVYMTIQPDLLPLYQNGLLTSTVVIIDENPNTIDIENTDTIDIEITDAIDIENTDTISQEVNMPQIRPIISLGLSFLNNE